MNYNLYDYQEKDLNKIFDRLEASEPNYRLLYQLPTGGGKTRVFSAIADRFLKTYGKKVIVLTHRLELCGQTSLTLKKLGVNNKVINSTIKRIPLKVGLNCYVAMVETLKNRIRDRLMRTEDVGLVIIDEAHHNSFQKLLDKFTNARIIGVTATPLSSDVNLPMRKYYNELLTGQTISDLISEGYLAKPSNWRYDVELNTLKTGIHGDFTVSTSDELYSSPAMLELLLHAYEAHSKNKKTLIFNNGIFTSKNVCKLFNDAGYKARHLDNQTPAAARADILKWFKTTKGAILSSVSILTTGFDEPTVQTVILNRATTSLTLYHQMIGRGSRRLPQKKTFAIIDLGNNTDRFGEWNTPVDWEQVFTHPEAFYEVFSVRATQAAHNMPSDSRAKFPNSLEIAFDIQQAYDEALAAGQKAKSVIRESIKQHVRMCVENASTVTEALDLTDELQKEIAWRIKQYAKCLGKVTKNYRDWLEEDYNKKLKVLVQKIMQRKKLQKVAV